MFLTWFTYVLTISNFLQCLSLITLVIPILSKTLILLKHLRHSSALSLSLLCFPRLIIINFFYTNRYWKYCLIYFTSCEFVSSRCFLFQVPLASVGCLEWVLNLIPFSFQLVLVGSFPFFLGSPKINPTRCLNYIPY